MSCLVRDEYIYPPVLLFILYDLFFIRYSSSIICLSSISHPPSSLHLPSIFRHHLHLPVMIYLYLPVILCHPTSPLSPTIFCYLCHHPPHSFLMSYPLIPTSFTKSSCISISPIVQSSHAVYLDYYP